jgi:hypothetical protein
MAAGDETILGDIFIPGFNVMLGELLSHGYTSKLTG